MVFSKFGQTKFSLPFLRSDSAGSKDSAGTARILVVDGSAQARGQIASVLDVEGYSYQMATGGSAALEHLQTESFDLVLTDMMML